MISRNMRRALMVTGVAALSAGMLAGSATAGPQGKRIGKLAAKQCQQERRAMDRASFLQTYGKPAFPRCMGVNRPELRRDLRSSHGDCKAERQQGIEAFREEYGTNRNKRNAYGKCVSGKVRADLRENRRDHVNAARACKTERTEMGAQDFRETYGSNRNQRNAFGKCVSQKARAADTD